MSEWPSRTEKHYNDHVGKLASYGYSEPRGDWTLGARNSRYTFFHRPNKGHIPHWSHDKRMAALNRRLRVNNEGDAMVKGWDSISSYGGVHPQLAMYPHFKRAGSANNPHVIVPRWVGAFRKGATMGHKPWGFEPQRRKPGTLDVLNQRGRSNLPFMVPRHPVRGVSAQAEFVAADKHIRDSHLANNSDIMTTVMGYVGADDYHNYKRYLSEKRAKRHSDAGVRTYKRGEWLAERMAMNAGDEGDPSGVGDAYLKRKYMDASLADMAFPSNNNAMDDGYDAYLGGFNND